MRRFRNAGGYGVLLHEVIHWTGSEKTLERIKKSANREAYAFEGLVAETGACPLGAQIGVASDFDQNAAHVEGWLKALEEDTCRDDHGWAEGHGAKEMTAQDAQSARRSPEKIRHAHRSLSET